MSRYLQIEPTANLDAVKPGASMMAERSLSGEEKSLEDASAAIAMKLERVHELAPKINSDGSFFYPDLEDLQVTVDKILALEYMANKGILKREPIGTFIACPSCGRADAIPTVKCSKCGATTLDRERLIEHKAGGHIHPENKFKQGSRIVCPTCNRELKDPDYRVLGMWFNCLSCGAKHAQLVPEFKCLKDGIIFSTATGLLKQLYKYTLVEGAIKEQGISKRTIAQILTQVFGDALEVREAAMVKGKSGAEHTFDMAVKRGEDELLFDFFVSKDPIGDSVVLSGFAKSIDIGTKNYHLVILPNLAASARNLASIYKIATLEASSEDELKAKAQELKQKLLAVAKK